MSYCNDKCDNAERKGNHPAVRMTRPRAGAWEQQAADADFYQYLQTLAELYARRHYEGRGRLDENSLFVDYKKWKDDGYGGKIEMSSSEKSG